MNKIYKVIWSKVRNCYVAVSEIAKRNGKSCTCVNCDAKASRGRAGLALAVALSLSMAGGGVAWAEDVVSDRTVPPGSAVTYVLISDGITFTVADTGDVSSIRSAKSGNTVNIQSGGRVSGAYAVSLENNTQISECSIVAGTSNNEVNSEGSIALRVYGGASEASTVQNNAVTISGGTVGGSVYGGWSAASYNAINNSVTISGGKVNREVYGGFSTGIDSDLGRAQNNTVSISGGTVNGMVFGGWSSKSTVGGSNGKGNSVIISGGTVNYNVYGGKSENQSATYNEVNISGGTITGNNFSSVQGGSGKLGAHYNIVNISGTSTIGTESYNSTYVFGGKTDGSGSANNNTVDINLTTGKIWGSVYGGHTASSSLSHSANDNEVNIEKGTVSNQVFGGYANYGDASSNKVYIKPGASVTGSVTGGLTSEGKAQLNTVAISGGAVSGEVIGGSSTRGTAGGYTTNGTTITKKGNTVEISSGTVTNNVYGGYANNTGANATYNTVTISGGTVGGTSKSVYGGWAKGQAQNNTVSITGGTVTANVYGGYSTGYEATNNTVELKGVTVNGNVYGGFSNNFNNSVPGNTLELSKAGNSVGVIFNFETIKITSGVTLGSGPVLSTMRFEAQSDNTFKPTLDITGATSLSGATTYGRMTLLSATDGYWSQTKLKYDTNSPIPLGNGTNRVIVKAGEDSVTNTDKGVGITRNPKTHIVSLSNDDRSIVYSIADNVTGVTFGNMTWGTPRNGSVSGTHFDFGGVTNNNINATNLSFSFADEAQKAGLSSSSSMTLLSNATNLAAGLAVTGASRTQTIDYNAANGTILSGTLTGTVSTVAGAVKYQASSMTLDSVNLTGWNSAKNSVVVPDGVITGWTRASGGVPVTTGSFTTSLLPGQSKEILTTSVDNFFGTVSGEKVYITEELTNDTDKGVTFAGNYYGGVKVEENGRKLTYYAETKNVTGITLGNMEWGTNKGRVVEANSLYIFNNVNTVDASGLAFAFTNDQKAALSNTSTMTLLSNATGLVAGKSVTGNITGQTYNHSQQITDCNPGNGTKLNGTLTGTISTDAGVVNYTANGMTLDNVNLANWDCTTTSDIPAGWTGTNVAVNTGTAETGSFDISSFKAGDTKDIFTTRDDITFGTISGIRSYSTATFSNDEGNTGVTLSGNHYGGVNKSSDGKTLTYYAESMDTTGITLGNMTWGNTTGRPAGDLYIFNNVNTVDASGLAFTFTNDQTGALQVGSTMTLLSNATGLPDGKTVTYDTTDPSKTSVSQDIEHNVNGVNLKGTLTGQVATSSSAKAVTYTATGVTLGSVNLANWDAANSSNVPTGWTGTNVSVNTGTAETGSFDISSFKAGDTKDIFTTRDDITFGTVSGIRAYSTETFSNDEGNTGVTLSGNHYGGVNKSTDNKTLTYYAESMDTTGITLGNMTWGTTTGRTAGSLYIFNNVNTVDASGLAFTFTNDQSGALTTGSTMTLLSNATGLPDGKTVTYDTTDPSKTSVSQDIEHNVNGVNLKGTLTGQVATSSSAKAVTYTATGVTLDSVNLAGWDGSTSSTVPAGWTANASGVTVNTDSMTNLPELAAGASRDILTASAGYFALSNIQGANKYGNGDAFNDNLNGVALAGHKLGGIKDTNSGATLTYFAMKKNVETITLGKMAFTNGGTGATLNAVYDATGATISADGLKFTEATRAVMEPNDSMILVDATGAIKNASNETLTQFNGGAAKTYNIAFSDTITGKNLTLAGTHTDTLEQDAAKTKLTYTVGAKEVSNATLSGSIVWSDGGVHYTNGSDANQNGKTTLYTFSGNTAVDIGGVAFSAAADPLAGATKSMTLLKNVAGVAADKVTGSPSFAVTLDQTNTKLDAKATGAAGVSGSDVTYTVSGVAIDKVTLKSAGNTADKVPANWTLAAGATVETDGMTVPTLNAGTHVDILQSDTDGFFANVPINGANAYGKTQDTFTEADAAQSVTIAGTQDKGVTLNSEKKHIIYKAGTKDVASVTLGSVAWQKGATLLDASGAGYDYSKVASLNMNGFEVAYASPETVTAGDSMTLLQANATLKDMAEQAKQTAYSYAPVAGVTVDATITGNLASKGGAVTYTAAENKANKLTFTNVPWTDNGTLMTRPANITFAGADVDTTKIGFNNISLLDANKKMTLVSDFGNTVGTITGTKYMLGTTNEGEGSASLENGNLIFTTKTGAGGAAEQTHRTVMATEAGVATLAAGQDYVDSAVEGLGLLTNLSPDGSSTFAAMGGGASRYKTGSHVDTHTWNAVVAVGSKRDHAKGSLEWGVFAEYGRGNYTLHNDDGGRGDGDTHYAGGGLLAKWTNKHNVYTEASFRMGRISDSASNMLQDGAGNQYGYNVHATYYGGHVGVGKLYEVKKNHELDVYGKFFYTRRNGVSFNAAGQYDLDAVASSLLRVGARYGTTDKKWNWYGGLAYEYQFDGEAKGMLNGNTPIRAASIKGGSVRGEIGMRMDATKTNPWKADISIYGYGGRHRGFGGNVSVAYMF